MKNPKVVMGVNFERAWRTEDIIDASVVVMSRQNDAKILVISWESFRGTPSRCLELTAKAFRDCPEKIEEIMAGSNDTLTMLGYHPQFAHLLNLPQRRHQSSGKHIYASLDRLLGRF